MKKTAKKPVPRTLPKPPPRSSARLWGLAALGLLAAGGTWAILEFVVWNNIPSALVGKWEVTSEPLKDSEFEFFRNGKMVGRLNDQGMLRVLNASVRVEEDQIYSTTRHPQTGQELTTVQTIRKLTAHELVIEDQKGMRMTMHRVE